jgi:AcrR family transcriptional regulator
MASSSRRLVASTQPLPAPEGGAQMLRAVEKPRRKRERDPEDKRERILLAAETLFAAHGFAQTTTLQIAREAGVSEGVLFLHFGSKQGVLNAISSSYGALMALAAMEGSADDVVPDTRRIVQRVFAHVEQHGLLHEVIGCTRDPEDANSAFRSLRQVVVSALEKVLVAWKSRGFGSYQDTQITAALGFGLVQTALTECFVQEKGQRRALYVETCVRWFEAALGLPRSPTPPVCS